jgi:hypothetical protein
MFMFKLRLRQPVSKAPISRDLIMTMITNCAEPGDGIEHVYIETGRDGQVDVVAFISTTDLVPALVNGAALTSRLLHGSFRDWSVLRVCVESAI